MKLKCYIPLFLVIVLLFTYFRIFEGIGTGKVSKDDAGTTYHENGDTTYHSSEENIVFDDETCIQYFNNILNVYLKDDLDTDECEELAKTVDGQVCGYLSNIVTMIQIKVDETSLDELKSKASELMKNKYVLYANYDIPIEFSPCEVDSDPWNSSTKSIQGKNNENNPEGNDWWAEAIKAYTAWEKYDSAEISDPTTVGVIDSGFFTKHEELEGNIEFPDGYTENIPNSHGTSVCGFIAAKHNDKGIRGVADKSKLICIDNTHGKKVFNNTAEFIEMNVAVIQKGAKVINNSYGNTMFCKNGYSDDNLGKKALDEEDFKKIKSYDDYLSLLNNTAVETGKDCMLLIYYLMLNEESDFIFVQGAGNGYNDAWGEKSEKFETAGHDAFYTGYYNAINAEVFNKLNTEIDNAFTKSGITYDMIANHKLTVGAVQNTTDDKGRYYAALGSSFGKNVDIFTPGDDLFSIDYDKLLIQNINISPYSKSKSGTSFACPIVSGSLALLWSLKPSLTAGELKTLVCKSSIKAIGVGEDNGSVYPMLNVGEAAKKICDKKEKTPTTTEKEKPKAKEEAVLISANENDFNDFINYFSGYALLNRVTSFDCKNSDTEEIISFLFNGTNGLSFKKVPQASITDSDPLNRMTSDSYSDGTIYTISESSLKFICEDIFNTAYSSPKSKQNGVFDKKWCRYNYIGNLYFWGGPAGITEEYQYELIGHTALDDGKYSLDIISHRIDPDYDHQTNLTVSAGLKKNDAGEKYWSIYSIFEVDNDSEKETYETTTEKRQNPTEKKERKSSNNKPWFDALRHKLYELLNEYGNSETCTFELYDADFNSIPEIYLCLGQSRISGAFGYSYSGSKYSQMGTFGDFGDISYNEDNQYFRVSHGGPGIIETTIYEISNDSLNKLASYSENSVISAIYEINGNEVSQSEYEDFVYDYDNMEWINLGEKYTLSEQNIEKTLSSVK